MLLFNQCLAFILALVIATEFNAERGDIVLEKKPIIFGRSTGAASELCEAARILQPLSEIGELGDDKRFVSHVTTAPKSFRTLEARQKGDSTEARFIGDDARTEGMIKIPIRTIRGVRHYATSAQYYAVFFGDGENSERVAYALRGPISGSALDASKARVERLNSLNNEDIRALGNTRTRFYMLIRDEEGNGTLRSFELENDISENRRVPLTLRIGEYSAAAFDVSSFMYNYLLIADTNSFHVIDLRREVPRVYSVGIDSNTKPHPDIQIRDSGSKERHFFVAYENGVIQRFVFILEDISHNPPIEPLVKQADNIQLDGPAHILGLDSFTSELIVASHVKGTLLLVGVAKTLSVVDTLHDDSIEILKSPVRYLHNEHQAGVILEVKRNGRLYQYAQEIRITPCFISTFYPLTVGSKEETQRFGYGMLSTGNDFDLSSSVQYSRDNGSTWYDYNSGAPVNTLKTGFFRRSNVCAKKKACIHKYIEDPSFLLLLNSNVVGIFVHTKSEESSKWYWRILAENIEGRSYSGVARNIHNNTEPPGPTSKVSSSLQPTKTSSSSSGSISSSEVPVTSSHIVPPDPDCNTGSRLWWNMNDYSHDWNPKTYGLIIQGQTKNDFIFANGTTRPISDNSSATYWTGALWYRPYSGGDSPVTLDNFPWMNFSNPILTLSANGSGNITFEVSWYNGEREASNTAKRVAVLDWNSSSISGAEPHPIYSITPTFFGRKYVSPGFFETKTYPDSYPKEFIDWIDASLRGWFYTSGAELDYRKPPLPFRVQLLTTSSCQTTSASSYPTSSETISSEYISTKSEHSSSSTSVSSTSSIHPSPDPGPDNKTTCEAYRVFAEDSSYGPYDLETERWVSRLSDAIPSVYHNAQLISMGDKKYRLSFYGGGKIASGHVDVMMSSVKLIGHIYERTNVGTVISVVVHGTDSDNADKLATYLIRGRIFDEEIDASAFTTRRIEGFNGMDMRAFIGSQRYGASNNQILALSRNEEGKLLGLTLSPGPLTVSEPVDTGFVLSEASTILYDVTPERKFFVAVYDPRTGVFGVKDMSTANPPITVLYTGATLAKGHIVAVTGTYEPGLQSIPAARRYFLSLEDGRVLSVDHNPKSGLQMVADTHLDPSSVLLGADESSSDVYAFIPSKEQIAVLKPEMARNSLVERFDIAGIKLLEETPLKSPDKLLSGLYVDGVQDGNLVQYSLSVRSTPCFIFAIRDNFLTAKVGTKVPVTYRVFAPVSPTENQVSYSLQYSNDFGDSWFTQDKNKKVPTHVDTGVIDPSNICGSSQNCQKHRIGDVTPYREGAYTGAGVTWIEITKEILPRYWRVVATNALGKAVSNTRFRKEYPKPESSSISSSAAPSSSGSAVPSSSDSSVPSSSDSAVPSSSGSAVPSISSSAAPSSSDSAVPSSSGSAAPSSSGSAVPSISSSVVPSSSDSAVPSSSGSAVPSISSSAAPSSSDSAIPSSSGSAAPSSSGSAVPSISSSAVPSSSDSAAPSSSGSAVPSSSGSAVPSSSGSAVPSSSGSAVPSSSGSAVPSISSSAVPSSSHEHESESRSSVSKPTVSSSSESERESSSIVPSSSLGPTPTPSPEQAVADIIWTPQESWTNLIFSRIIEFGGGVNIDRGVTTTDNRTFFFPADGARDESGNALLTGKGTVTYYKFCVGSCILNSTFVDPKVVILKGKTGSYLEFTLYYREVEKPGVTQGPFTVKFADLLFDNARSVVENELVKRADSGKTVFVSNIRVNLTSDGRQAFGGSYEEGDMGVLALRYPLALEEDVSSSSLPSSTELHSDASVTDTEKGVSVITTVVTEYTTYCPDPTTFVEGSSTYTAAEPTTWTITDCPCTLTQTISSAVTEVLTAYTTSCPEPTVLTHETPKPAPSGQTSEAPKPAPSGEPDIPVPKGSGSMNSLNVALALAAFTLFWF